MSLSPADAVIKKSPATEGRLNRKFRKELNAGLAGLVLLAILNRAGDDLYGYQIAKHLKTLSRHDNPMALTSLYPVLRHLAANQLLTSRIVPSYAGPARRYYRITPLGQAMLADWQKQWEETSGFVGAALGAGAPA